MSRSERKRHREKKRRSKVNAGFDDLKELLHQIDPSMAQQQEEMNRVDLIGKSVDMLRKLFEENEKNKMVLTNLTQASSGDNNTVTMMIPYLVPVDEAEQQTSKNSSTNTTNVAPRSYPAPPYPPSQNYS